MIKQFFYKNIFMFGSLQSVGHTEEYFAAHSEKLVVYIIMPRVQNRRNLLRIYRRGRLVRELPVWSSVNFFLYYMSWFFHYWKFILTYFKKYESLIVLSGHPISFFGMTIQKLLRKITFVFWVGDYYPPVNWQLIIYEKLKKFYHDRVPLTYYLSNKINEKFNGRVMHDLHHRTVMWGVEAAVSEKRTLIPKVFNILFVGLVKEGQGLELLFSFLTKHREYQLKIIGVCEEKLFNKCQLIIKNYKINNQVYFPNKFYADYELGEIAKACQVGIALYDLGPLNITYYTDPGKIKTYAELGLPIVMTNTSEIATYIKKFHSGEVIAPNLDELENALLKIRENYVQYQRGLGNFNKYFAFESYYKKAFIALEKYT